MINSPTRLWLLLRKILCCQSQLFLILPPPPPHILRHLPFSQSSSGTYKLFIFQTNEDTLELIPRTESSYKIIKTEFKTHPFYKRIYVCRLSEQKHWKAGLKSWSFKFLSLDSLRDMLGVAACSYIINLVQVVKRSGDTGMRGFRVKGTERLNFQTLGEQYF